MVDVAVVVQTTGIGVQNTFFKQSRQRTNAVQFATNRSTRRRSISKKKIKKRRNKKENKKKLKKRKKEKKKKKEKQRKKKKNKKTYLRPPRVIGAPQKVRTSLDRAPKAVIVFKDRGKRLQPRSICSLD